MLKTTLSLAALVLGTATAGAHIVLETKEAPVGESYKAVFRVTHGCEQAPTTGLRVAIPEGLIGVKPMPKPGWEVKVARGRYQGSYAFYHGKTLTEGVTEVTWSGGELPNEFVDEFALVGFLARELKPGATLRFSVVQECAGGRTTEWVEVPKDASDHPDRPAPGVTLTEADERADH